MTVWRRQPKVELHLHLEGAAPPDFIRALAAEQGTDLVGVFDEAGAYAWTDFADFLKVYEAASSVLRAADDYRRLVEAVLAVLAAVAVLALAAAAAWYWNELPSLDKATDYRPHQHLVFQGANSGLIERQRLDSQRCFSHW